MADNTKQQKQAYKMIVEQGHNLKTTAAAVGVSTKTIGKWATLYGWKKASDIRRLNPSNIERFAQHLHDVDQPTYMAVMGHLANWLVFNETL